MTSLSSVFTYRTGWLLAVVLSLSACNVQTGRDGTTQGDPILIVGHPQPVTVSAGESATFRVDIAARRQTSPPEVYQWLRDGIAIPGASHYSFTLSSTTQADDGAMFSVNVRDGVHYVTSAAARLTVCPVPPRDVDVRAHGPAACGAPARPPTAPTC
jgi:hypothetical protein